MYWTVRSQETRKELVDLHSCEDRYVVQREFPDSFRKLSPYDVVFLPRIDEAQEVVQDRQADHRDEYSVETSDTSCESVQHERAERIDFVQYDRVRKVVEYCLHCLHAEILRTQFTLRSFRVKSFC